MRRGACNPSFAWASFNDFCTRCNEACVLWLKIWLAPAPAHWRAVIPAAAFTHATEMTLADSQDLQLSPAAKEGKKWRTTAPPTGLLCRTYVAAVVCDIRLRLALKHWPSGLGDLSIFTKAAPDAQARQALTHRLGYPDRRRKPLAHSSDSWMSSLAAMLTSLPTKHHPSLWQDLPRPWMCPKAVACCRHRWPTPRMLAGYWLRQELASEKEETDLQHQKKPCGLLTKLLCKGGAWQEKSLEFARWAVLPQLSPT